MPRACARATIALTGRIVPRAFERWAIETIRVRGVRSRSSAATSTLPSSSMRRHGEPGALLLAQHLPGHDVRVVLETRDEDLVAPADPRPAVRLRHEVDRLGRAPDEDDLLRLGGVQKALGPSRGRHRRHRSHAPRASARRGECWRSTSRTRRARNRSRPGASGPRRRCRGTRGASRRPSSRGSGSRAGSPRRRRRRPLRAGRCSCGHRRGRAGENAGRDRARLRRGPRGCGCVRRRRRRMPRSAAPGPPLRRFPANGGRRGPGRRAGPSSSRACTSRRRRGSRAPASS